MCTAVVYNGHLAMTSNEYFVSVVNQFERSVLRCFAHAILYYCNLVIIPLHRYGRWTTPATSVVRGTVASTANATPSDRARRTGRPPSLKSETIRETEHWQTSRLSSAVLRFWNCGARRIYSLCRFCVVPITLRN